jgi:hypothetical protein
MPADHSWDEESRILRIRLRGHVTNEDILGDALKIYGDSRIRAPIREIIDLREVESTSLTINDLRNLVQMNVSHAERFEERYQALVAPTDELRSMARSFATFSQMHLWPHRTRVFETLCDAEEWLSSVMSEEEKPAK